MADEKPEDKELHDLPELPGLSPEEKGPGADAPAFEKEPQKMMDVMTFWNGVDAQTSATVVAPIDAPPNVLETMPFTGKIVFKEFPDTAHSFHGEAKRIHGDNPDAPNVSLVLSISGILAAVADAIRKYTAKGEKLGNVIRLAEGSLPLVFRHVFQAIREKSPDLYWTRGSAKEHGGKSIPLVSYVYDSNLDKDLGINLVSSFEGMRAKINEQAEEVLRTEKPRAEKPAPAFKKRQSTIRNFTNKIPKEKYKVIDNSMMAPLTMEEVQILGGDEVVESIKSLPEIGAMGWREETDGTSYWVRYNPSTNTVVFEDKQATDRMLLEKVQRMWKTYGTGTPQSLFAGIASQLGVDAAAVKEWFRKLFDKLTPEKREKVEEIFESTGIKKIAYPDVPWAGPALTQVGNLVGDAQAKWASELAGNLASRLDYISFPKLEGSPSDLKKLATLPLTPSQSARVSQYNAKAKQILRRLLKDLYMGVTEEEGTEFVTPDDEEVDRLAEDILLEVVDSTPSAMSDEEFEQELTDRLFAAMKMAQKHPHAIWPSLKTGPEDALHDPQVSLHPTQETPELVGVQKKALQRDDAIEIMPHPHVHKVFHGKMGKVLDTVVDLFICPTHGPEPVVRYVVQLEGPKHEIISVTDDELRPAGSTN